jgi:hypothetical protein
MRDILGKVLAILGLIGILIAFIALSFTIHWLVGSIVVAFIIFFIGLSILQD